MLLNFVTITARIAVATVFAVSSMAKFYDLRGSRDAMTSFGVPWRFSRILALGLPFAEFAGAGFLLALSSTLIGGTLCLFLLIAFLVAIAVNMARGKRPLCHCFGQIYARPIGWATLVRNLVLGALAGILIWQPTTSSNISVESAFGVAGTWAFLIMAIALAATGLLVRLVLLFPWVSRIVQMGRRTSADTPLRQQEPLVGKTAFPFDLPNVAGGRSTLNAFLQDAKPVLLIFMDPECSGCNELMPEIAVWQQTISDLVIAVICRGSAEINSEKALRFGLMNVLHVPDEKEVFKIAAHYHLQYTPMAVLVRADGICGTEPLGRPSSIREYVSKANWSSTLAAS